jgi:hypothetical protein
LDSEFIKRIKDLSSIGGRTVTHDEIKIRLIRQELARLLDYHESTEDSDPDLIETVIDRVIDLTRFIDNNVSLPPCYVKPWSTENEH